MNNTYLFVKMGAAGHGRFGATILFGLASLSLVSCGGGGGGASSPPSMPDDPPSMTIMPPQSGGEPQLVIESFAVSDNTIGLGERFTVFVTMANQGNGRSADQSLLLHFKISNDPEIDISDYTGGSSSRTFASLEPGETVTFEPITLGTRLYGGIYYYGVCAVSSSNSIDSSIGNNCSSSERVWVMTAGPDLTVDSFSVSDTILEPGQQLTLSAQVRNVGSIRTPATTVRYTHRRISSAGGSGFGGAVRSLEPGEAYSWSTTLTAPSLSDIYFYGACVDSFSGEFNPRNNCVEEVSVEIGE